MLFKSISGPLSVWQGYEIASLEFSYDHTNRFFLFEVYLNLHAKSVVLFYKKYYLDLTNLFYSAIMILATTTFAKNLQRE